MNAEQYRKAVEANIEKRLENGELKGNLSELCVMEMAEILSAQEEGIVEMAEIVSAQEEAILEMGELLSNLMEV